MSKRTQYDAIRKQAFDLGLPKKGYGKKPLSFYQDIISGKTAIPTPIQKPQKLTKTGKVRKPYKKISQERRQQIRDTISVYSQIRNRAKEYGLIEPGKGKQSAEYYKNLIQNYENKLVIKTAINKSVQDAVIDISDDNLDDLIVLKRKYSHLIKKFLRQVLASQNINFQLKLNTEMVSRKLTDENDEMKTKSHFFATKSIKILKGQQDEIDEVIDNLFDQVSLLIEQENSRGSEWVISSFKQILLNSTKFKSVVGSSYFELLAIKGHKAFLNIRNIDDKCFLWCLTAFFHPTEKAHPERTSHYSNFISEWNTTSMDFPMKVNDIPKFLKQNSQKMCGMGINVFGLNNQQLVPIKIDKNPHNSIDLLLIEDEETGKKHYVLIKDINSYGEVDKKNRTYICKNCLCYRSRDENLLKEHIGRCLKNEAVQIVLPNEDNKILKFKSYKNMLPVEFIIVYDFETNFLPVTPEKVEDDDCDTVKINKHVPNSVMLQTICFSDDKYNRTKIIHDFNNHENVISQFCQYLFEEEQRIYNIKADIKPMQLTEKEELEYKYSKTCHICREAFLPFEERVQRKDWKVRDHCHLTGRFRGAAHNGCNLNLKYSSHIPVIAHNSKNYDTNLFINDIANHMPSFYSLSCIPNNEEKYISFSLKKTLSDDDDSRKFYHELRFLDSFSFLASSLDKLAAGLSNDDFVLLRRAFANDEQFEMAKKKGFYPYEYMDDKVSQKMLETCLPPIEAFSSKLYGGAIGNQSEFEDKMSDNDYVLAQKAWETFGCQSLFDYHMMYLKIDVFLLCDIIQSFRKISMKTYNLDPMQYYTLPGYSWDALLLHSNIKLELLTDVDMVLMIEGGMRGGISTIKHRYAKSTADSSNNEKTFLRYWDANNLYGWAMSCKLPCQEFKWDDASVWTEEKILSIGDSDNGYIFEVDIEVPKDNQTQDYLKDYPLLPEHYIAKSSEFSPYQQSFEKKESTVEKLCLTLHDKKKYVVHYKALQQAMKYGYRVTNIHRVLSFTQSAWMKSYIELNTNLRKLATTDFEKDFYKLMNNSVFGKTMENVRNRINFSLIRNEEELMRYTNKINFKSHTTFQYGNSSKHGLIGVHMLKQKVKLNKPVYVGFSILDLSKTLMYDFHYDYIKKSFGSNATLLFTDTDSLCYAIKSTEEHFMTSQKENINLFDNSAYLKDNLLYNAENKKVIGKFKDECDGFEMNEFVGLRSKLYSFTLCKKDKCKAKGVKKCVANKLKLDNYKSCLFNKTSLNVKFRTFRSYKHQIYTIESSKLALSPFDDKNFILDDGISTVPYGHYLTC